MFPSGISGTPQKVATSCPCTPQSSGLRLPSSFILHPSVFFLHPFSLLLLLLIPRHPRTHPQQPH